MKDFFLIALLCLLVGTLCGEEMFKDPRSRVTYPTRISHKGHELEATGATTYTVLFVKIYSTVHYMENRIHEEGYDQFYDPAKAKMNMNTWLYGISYRRFKKKAQKAFEKYGDVTEIQPLIDEYLGYFDGDISRGDKHAVWWLPGGIIEVYVNGELRGTMQNGSFARIVWQNLFGKHSKVNRRDLISRLTLADKEI